jgi:ADP-ribose pyrophosphatase
LTLPKVQKLRDRTVFDSPWMALVERTVSLGKGSKVQPYYFVRQKDYVSILAITPDRKIPLVRQYRPAVRRFTLELPAGTVDRGETPESTCKKELLEETGLRSARTYFLGARICDSGRLGNRIHNFFVQTVERSSTNRRTAELSVRYVTIPELIDLAVTGRFDLQLHLGTLWLAIFHPRSGAFFRNARLGRQDDNRK